MFKWFSDLKIQNKLMPYYEVHQFGSEKFIDTKRPSEEHTVHCQKGLAFAFKVIKKKPDLLILDELGLAATIGLVNTKDILKLIEQADSKTAIYITGRSNPRELIKRADFVTLLRTLKQPKEPEYIKGIEY